MEGIRRFMPLVGRMLLTLIFLSSAPGHIGSWEQTTGYMASKGMPVVSLALAAAIVLELAGGLSVLLGFKARIGAAALIVFLVPATLIFHNFWAFEGAEQQAQMIHFMKNVAIMGGLLLVIAHGPGALSLDERRGNG